MNKRLQTIARKTAKYSTVATITISGALAGGLLGSAVGPGGTVVGIATGVGAGATIGIALGKEVDNSLKKKMNRQNPPQIQREDIVTLSEQREILHRVGRNTNDNSVGESRLSPT